MTLDEYRATLIERLRACQDTTEARDLLAEANLVLADTKLNRLTRDRFWETLEEELDAAGENLTLFKDPTAAAAFAAVVAAVRARIARYRTQPEGESSSTG